MKRKKFKSQEEFENDIKIGDILIYDYKDGGETLEIVYDVLKKVSYGFVKFRTFCIKDENDFNNGLEMCIKFASFESVYKLEK